MDLKKLRFLHKKEKQLIIKIAPRFARRIDMKLVMEETTYYIIDKLVN